MKGQRREKRAYARRRPQNGFEKLGAGFGGLSWAEAELLEMVQESSYYLVGGILKFRPTSLFTFGEIGSARNHEHLGFEKFAKINVSPNQSGT